MTGYGRSVHWLNGPMASPQISLGPFHTDWWEGVVLIPFIDEQKLLAVSRSIQPSASTPMEQTCNQHGSMVIFKHAGGAREGARNCADGLPEDGAAASDVLCAGG